MGLSGHVRADVRAGAGRLRQVAAAAAVGAGLAGRPSWKAPAGPRSRCWRRWSLVDGAMLAALLSNDFALRYVADNSSRERPRRSSRCCRCGPPTTVRCCSGTSSSPATSPPSRSGSAATGHRPSRTRSACCSRVQVFYLILVNGPARPFAGWRHPPADGRGPAPLLQNHPLMAVHPPFLYLGFIGFTVPFAFGIASLLAGTWIGLHGSRLIRRWTLAGLVLPDRRAVARRAVVVLGARLGRLLGLGPGGERRAAALAPRPPPSCTRSCCRNGAAWPGCGTSRSSSARSR